jgi:RNA polymerase sigma-70 factor (ECF subfamily)
MRLSKAQAIYPHSGHAARVGALDGMSREEGITAAELHERYLDDVYRYVVQRVRTIEEAEDVTAEVFAAAAAGLPRFRGQCPPHLWLLSIARRRIARAARRRAVRRETLASELAEAAAEAASIWEALAEVEGPETALMRAEASRVLEELVARLSPDQREALALQYRERLTIAEIAMVMERSPASVKSLLQRAREVLRRRGRSYFVGDEPESER